MTKRGAFTTQAHYKKKNIIQRKPRDKINNKNRQVDKKEKAATKECTC